MTTVDPFSLVLHIRQLIAAGNLPEAEARVHEAYASFPNHPDVIFEAGILYIHNKQWADAEQLFRKVVAMSPKYIPARRNLAHCLMESQNYLAAEGVLLEAAGYAPTDPAIHHTLGEIYYRTKQTKKCISSLERATRLEPNSPEYQSSLGLGYLQNKENDRAKQCFDRAAKLGSTNNGNYYNLGSAYALTGQSQIAFQVLSDALNREPASESTASALFMSAINHPEIDGIALNQLHQRYESVVRAQRTFEVFQHTAPKRPDESRRIRIGFFSNDFKHHALGQFLIAVLHKIDRQKFELFAYSTTPDFDQTSAKIIPAVDTFADMRHLSHDDAAKCIFDDHPDILIDLSGHTMNNRLAILARKPAPLVMSWLGYLAPTGLSAVDYHITDVHSNPPGETEGAFGEKFIRLPLTMYTYAPTNMMTKPIEVGPLPARTNGFVTFGCFGYPTKMNDVVIRTWAQVLSQLPTARMLIYCEMDETRQRIYKEFEKHGIKRARIKFCGRVTVDDYMDRHNKVDVTLDTFPFVSGTTVSDSLYMGVPMVSRFLPRGFSGQSRSVLAQVGLEHHATGTVEEYVALAVKLATDLDTLEQLRQTLRQRLLSSPMMDAALVTKHFELGVMAALERYWNGLPPDHINVKVDEVNASAESTTPEVVLA